jgi:hypothetical protein
VWDEEMNKALVRWWWEEVWLKGKWTPWMSSWLPTT